MQKTIYVIDDEVDILEAISLILAETGFRVVTNTQFSSTNEIFINKPDLILCDVLLIGINGKEVCKQIRSDNRGAVIPIILLSAHPVSKLQAYVKECHASGYVQKPFDIDELTTTVKKYLT